MELGPIHMELLMVVNIQFVKSPVLNNQSKPVKKELEKTKQIFSQAKA